MNISPIAKIVKLYVHNSFKIIILGAKVGLRPHRKYPRVEVKKSFDSFPYSWVFFSLVHRVMSSLVFITLFWGRWWVTRLLSITTDTAVMASCLPLPPLYRFGPGVSGFRSGSSSIIHFCDTCHMYSFIYLYIYCKSLYKFYILQIYLKNIKSLELKYNDLFIF